MVGMPPIKMMINGGWFMALLYQHYWQHVSKKHCKQWDKGKYMDKQWDKVPTRCMILQTIRSI